MEALDNIYKYELYFYELLNMKIKTGKIRKIIKNHLKYMT